MRKYKAGSYKQAAAIARRSVGWDDEERAALKDIAEGRLAGDGFDGHGALWCATRKVGFIFHKSRGYYEISRIYIK